MKPFVDRNDEDWKWAKILLFLVFGFLVAAGLVVGILNMLIKTP